MIGFFDSCVASSRGGAATKMGEISLRQMIIIIVWSLFYHFSIIYSGIRFWVLGLGFKVTLSYSVNS